MILSATIVSIYNMVNDGSRLRSVIQAHVHPDSSAQVAQLDGVDSAAQEWLDIAHNAWPAAWVAPERFVAYVAARLPASVSAEDLTSVRAADLFLACACSEGHAEAISAFEARYGREVRLVLNAQRNTAISCDELMQEVWIKLFVAGGKGGERPPKIGEYSGRSGIRSWFRVIVSRSLIDMQRRGGRVSTQSGEDDDILWQLADRGDDPELAFAKRRSRSLLKRTFERAVMELVPRQRLLLRQHYVDHLSLDELAQLHQVHRTTASRWLDKARRDVLAQVRRILMIEVHADKCELAQVMDLASSHLDLSLSRVLAGTSTEAP